MHTVFYQFTGNNVILIVSYSFFTFIPEFTIYTIDQNLEMVHSFSCCFNHRIGLVSAKIPEGAISKQRTTDAHGLD